MCKSWNKKLASLAQNWADGCRFSHGNPSYEPAAVGHDEIGQNLYYSASSTTFKVMEALKDWFKEKSDYDYNSDSCTSLCTHYTQVWSAFVIRMWRT